MKSLIISLLLLIYSLSFAQIQWQENGVPVRQGENIVWSGTSVSLADGNLVCIWSDTRNGDRGIYAQKMSPDGELLWADEGIEVNDAVSIQDFPVAITTENNDVIIAWWNLIDWNMLELRAQKIDAIGNLQWDGEGLLLFSNESILHDIHIINDDSDGVLIFWNTNGPELLGLHILNDGSIAPGWNINGNQIITQYHNYLDIIADGYGGAVLSWTNSNDLYMQRVDGSGILLWGDNGTSLCNEDDIQDRVTISTNNDGIYYFFWRDYRNSSVNIYMQKVDQDGNKLWLDDLLLQGSIYANQIKSVMGNEGYPIICWSSNGHIYAQKIDSNGNILWELNGLPICLDEYCSYFDLQSDNYNGCWITWDRWFYPNANIYIQHVNGSGTILLEENGMSICSADYTRGCPVINTSNNDEIFISWEDWRTGSASLYSQIINFDGIIQLPENGTEIFGGLSGETYNLKILPNGDNPFLIWEDRNYIYDDQIYIQSLNSDGSANFAEDGIPITMYSNGDQENYDVDFHPGSNTIAVVWKMWEEEYKIYCQAVDLDGNFLWSDSTGLKVGGPSFHQDHPRISSINNSRTYEYYLGWEDFTDYMNSQIKGQKIINGDLQWGEDGKVIADREYNDELTDIIENYYIWQGSAWNYENIFCLLVDENGDPAPGWPENGLEICVAEGMQRKARGIIVPQGLLIIWEDRRNGDCDIFGQIVTPDGNILWQENGLPLVIQENDQVNFNFIYDDGLYAVWQDFRSSCNYEIYAQKFDEDGNELWQEGGVLVAGVDEMNRYYPDLVRVDNKNLIVWEEEINYYNSNIKAQLLDENGELLWQPQGIFICDMFMEHHYPKVVSNEEDDVYIAWQDGRSTILGEEGLVSIPGVYAQKVYIDPTSVENELISTRTELYPNYPNPFNPETTISFFTAKDAENAELVIYNIKGQKVKTLVNEVLPAGEHSVVWDGRDTNNKAVASGIYFYNLKVGNKSLATKKCLLLK
jgi:hypothetical protein